MVVDLMEYKRMTDNPSGDEDPTIIFDRETVYAVAHGIGNSTRPVFITLTPWAARPPGRPWGINFFMKRNVPVVAVVAKTNHWWHTKELFELARVIQDLTHGAPLILYGNSMGAYGVLHHRNTFGVKFAFAIAPQFAVAPAAAPKEHRWQKDRSEIQFIFDELENLNQQTAPCCVFLDPEDPLDRYQYELHAPISEVDTRGGLHLIPIPHFTHGAATHMAKSNLLAPIVMGAASGEFPDVDKLRGDLAHAYRLIPKPFFNYMRRLSKDLEPEEASLFLEYAENLVDYDYEAAFMASEVFLKMNRFAEAATWSDRSIVRVVEQSGRVSTDAACKHLRTLKKARGVDAAIAWWETIDEKHKTPKADEFYAKYILL